MKSIIDEFMVETDEIVDALDSNLVKLENEPDNLDLLNEIFRGAHTMKGTSGFLGFDELTRLTHRMEDVLNKLRKNELKVTPEIMDVLLEAVDYVKLVLQDIVEDKQGETNLDQIIQSLSAIYEGEPVSESEITASLLQAEKEKTAEIADSRADEKLSISPQDPAEQAVDGNNRLGVKKDLMKKVDSTIRVGVDRLDSLVNMVGELVLGRNALIQSSNMLQATHEGEKGFENLQQASSQVNFITTELHMAIMKMRMLQVGNVFNKFPRVVRDLSRDMKKKIDLKITGEETELDKSVIEEINDPLVHLIRNSVDHGIETPEDRIKAGKPERGTLNLSAYQEGNNIIIEVRDDGKGMNIEVIKQKAIDRELVTAEGAEKLSQKEILDFIFQPGFSTAVKTTNISGRGVGMDVVRTNIEKLKGMIELSSEEGQGSLVTIKLPLTLAIVQGLLVSCGKDIFAIPLTSVKETVIISPDQIKYVNQRPVIRLRDSILPLVELTDVLFNNRKEYDSQLRVVVVGLADKQLGLIVDSLIGQEEVVIKAMGDYLGNIPGVAGATIMGDGRVRLIVDLAGLFNLVLNK
ncbi:MAG: chemotaxis protein CheA [candidate division Zixibacteria bacterium]|nr:chemotaxis protein CheA [candidate division Zixibacteria bacterium]